MKQAFYYFVKKYCARLTTGKYFYTRFPFGIWLSNLHEKTRYGAWDQPAYL